MNPWIHDWPGLIYGLIVGASLGLTGGGGSIFAVPLLVYGLGLPVQTAIGLSLAAVGLTAGFGAVLRLRTGEVEVLPGTIFAVGGMLLAPLGTRLGHYLPPAVLLSVFAVLMSLVGWRMWRGKSEGEGETGPCRVRNGGRLSRECHLRLISAGALAGLLSGLFGIGGGFIIVPALLYVTGTSIHRAVATSLFVIFLISLSGVAAQLAQGQHFPMPLSVLFVAGGFVGMLVGGALRGRLSDSMLRQVFAIAMWGVGAYMLIRNIAAFVSP
jgi:uncharacterized membrane protein YfcA